MIAVAVPRLPTLAFPLTLAVPVMFAPVAVTTKVAVLVAVTVTLPLAVIETLLLPFCSRPLLIVVMLPVEMIAVAVPRLPTLALPLILATPVTVIPKLFAKSMLALSTCKTRGRVVPVPVWPLLSPT